MYIVLQIQVWINGVNKDVMDVLLTIEVVHLIWIIIIIMYLNLYLKLKLLEEEITLIILVMEMMLLVIE